MLPLLDYSLISASVQYLIGYLAQIRQHLNALEVCYLPFVPIVASLNVIVAFRTTLTLQASVSSTVPTSPVSSSPE